MLVREISPALRQSLIVEERRWRAGEGRMLCVKSNAPSLFDGLFDELVDGVKNNFELMVVYFLHLEKLAPEIFVRRQRCPKFHKGAHDLDVDLDGPFTLEHARDQGNALLGENKRPVFDVGTAFQGHSL